MGLSKGRLTAPFTFKQVAKCIGSGSQDLGKLCTHKNINIWNWCKPVRYKQKAKLLKEQFAITDISFGFDTAVIYTRGSKITIDNAMNYKDWPYLPPRGDLNTEPYRSLQDYDGYYHYAKCPYDTSENVTKYITYAPPAYIGSRSLVLQRVSEAEFHIEDFQLLTTDGYELSQWQYAVMWRATGDVGDELNIAYPSYTTDEKIYFDINFGDLGKYDCVFVFTTETTPQTMQLPTVWLPKGFLQVSIERALIPIEFTLPNFTLYAQQLADDMGNQYISISGIGAFSLPLQAAIPEDADYTTVVATSGSIAVYIEFYDAEGNMIAEAITWEDSAEHGQFSYSGSEATTAVVDFNAGNPITISGIDQDKIGNISSLKVRVYIETDYSDSSNGVYISTKTLDEDVYTITLNK